MSDLNPDVAAKLNSIHPMLGYAASVIFLLGILVNAWNTYRTKKNTSAHETTAALLTQAEQRFNEISEARLKEFRSGVEAFRKSVDAAIELFEKQSEEYKLKVMHLKEEADAIGRGLSRIPTVEMAVEAHEKKMLDIEFKAAQQDEKLDRFIAGLERLRRNKG